MCSHFLLVSGWADKNIFLALFHILLSIHQGLKLSLLNFEYSVVLIAVPIVLLVLCWRIALYFVPAVLSIFILPIVFIFITKKFKRVRKTLLRTLDKTAVESVNHVFVVKLLGINDLIVEKLLHKVEKTFR